MPAPRHLSPIALWSPSSKALDASSPGASKAPGKPGEQSMAIATVSDWTAQAEELQQLLGFEIPAVAITFQDHVNGTTPFGAPLAPPAADGRTGSVAAGCVFWMHATDRSFSTVPADHGNCSVGMMTHGLATLDEVAGNADVAEILASGWVSIEAIPGIPVVKERAES